MVAELWLEVIFSILMLLSIHSNFFYWIIQRSIGWGAVFPIQGTHVQNHWVTPRLTQPLILPRLIKWVPGIYANLVVKSKLPPRSGSSREAVEPHPWKGVIKSFFNIKFSFLFVKFRYEILSPKLDIQRSWMVSNR